MYDKIPLGAIPSTYDPRDYTVSMFVNVGAPATDDFTVADLPDIYDQGKFGMCVAFALSALKESQELKERKVRVRYSPGFIYANRKAGDYTGEGMQPREALQRLIEDGVCEYRSFPNVGTYADCWNALQKSNEDVRLSAKPQRIANYVRATTEAEIDAALKNLGPVAVTYAIYPSFYKCPGGMVPDVGLNETITGYHEMVIVGKRTINGQKRYYVQNSWGAGWGDKGRCYIPVDYKGFVEAWTVTDMAPINTRDVNLTSPVTLMNGRVVMGIRDIFESVLGGTVTWEQPNGKKGLVRAVIPAKSKSTIIEAAEGAGFIKVTTT